MATYKGIQGYSVQTLASDPSPTASVVGQLWYNTTSFAFKIATEGSGSWASGGALTTAVRGTSCLGTQTAALSCGGNIAGPITAGVDEYNGTAWTEVNAMGSAKYTSMSAGTVTAALIGGGVDGYQPPALSEVEEYNGSTWTEVTDLGTARYKLAQAVGTQTAAFAIGGRYPPTTVIGTVDEYNGASWTSSPALNTARQESGACGTTAAALVIGGMLPGATGVVEDYNGTSWTEVVDLNTARGIGGSAMAATNTTALYFGGHPYRAITESWNGTSWTEVGDMANNRQEFGGAGTGSAGLAVAGFVPPFTTACEEFESPVYSIKTVTVS